MNYLHGLMDWKNRGRLVFTFTLLFCIKIPTKVYSKFGGVYSGGVTPDPISNSVVKSAHGKNSAEVALC